MFRERFDKICNIKYNIVPMFDTLDEFLINVVKEYSLSSSLATSVYQLNDCLNFVKTYLENVKTIGATDFKDFMTNMNIPTNIISYIIDDTQNDNKNQLEDCFVVTITTYNDKKVQCMCNKCKREKSNSSSCHIRHVSGYSIAHHLYTKQKYEREYIVCDNNIHISKYNPEISLKENLIMEIENGRYFNTTNEINTNNYDITPGNKDKMKYWDLNCDKIVINEKFFVINCYDCNTFNNNSQPEYYQYTTSDKILKCIKIPLIDGVITDTPVGQITVTQKKLIKDFTIDY